MYWCCLIMFREGIMNWCKLLQLYTGIINWHSYWHCAEQCEKEMLVIIFKIIPKEKYAKKWIFYWIGLELEAVTNENYGKEKSTVF